MIDVPAGLRWWRTRPGGVSWLADLPAFVALACERWSLRLGAVFEAPQMIGFVAAVDRADGTRAILKLNGPDRECAHEAEALALWNGRGAVELLASDPGTRSFVLERCEPGTPLLGLEDDDAMRIVSASLRRLWRAAPAHHPFDLLADESRRWAQELPKTFERLGAPFERRILDQAVEACAELVADTIEPVVLHQDLHGGNVLRAEREPWLVIDPKPLVGERAFDVAAIVRDRGDMLAGPDGAAIIRRRLDILCDELGLERERMRLWSLIHALAWGVDDGGDEFDAAHVHVARLLDEAR